MNTRAPTAPPMAAARIADIWKQKNLFSQRCSKLLLPYDNPVEEIKTRMSAKRRRRDKTKSKKNKALRGLKEKKKERCQLVKLNRKVF